MDPHPHDPNIWPELTFPPTYLPTYLPLVCCHFSRGSVSKFGSLEVLISTRVSAALADPAAAGNFFQTASRQLPPGRVGSGPPGCIPSPTPYPQYTSSPNRPLTKGGVMLEKLPSPAAALTLASHQQEASAGTTGACSVGYRAPLQLTALAAMDAMTEAAVSVPV
jgi:hypothetical protein